VTAVLHLFNELVARYFLALFGGGVAFVVFVDGEVLVVGFQVNVFLCRRYFIFRGGDIGFVFLAYL
jgi:hypothetical protein